MVKSMTSGPAAKLIFLFTVPLLIGNLFQQLYNMADTFIVGRILGVDALAAVGSTGSLMFFIIGFTQGLAAGFSIITAQRFGAQDEEGVRRSFAASLLLGGAIAIVVTIFSVIGTRWLLEFLQTPPEIIDNAYRYLVVVFAGIPATMLFNILSNSLRALGDAKTPLIFLVVACIINVILDIVLILYTPLGVAGAGVATVTAQLFSGIACVVYIVKKFPALRLHASDWKITQKDISDHLNMGLPIGFQSSIIAIGSLTLQYGLNGLGSTAVGAFTAASKLETLGTMPLFSFGVATSTFVAQNYGAGKMHRIKKGVLQAGGMALAWSFFMCVIFLLFGKQLSALFVGDQPEAIRLSYTYLRIMGLSLWALALLLIFRYTLQGLGQSFVPTFAGVMELIMRCVCTALLIPPLGFTGACVSNVSAWYGSALPLVIAFFVTMHRLPLSRFARPEEEEECV